MLMDSLARDYVYPDYVDQEALIALAQAKGVSIDPLVLGVSEGSTTGWAKSTEVSGGLRTPIVELGSRVTTTESGEASIGRSIAIQRRHTMRWVVDELCNVLRAEGALREDLAFIPHECENELALVAAARLAVVEWGLAELLREAQAEFEARASEEWTEEDAGSRDSVEAEPRGEPIQAEPRGEPIPAEAWRWDPQEPSPHQLALALETILFAAGDVVRELMLAAATDVLGQAEKTLFALVRLRWGFDTVDGVGRLWNGGLVSRRDPEFMSIGPAPAVILVRPMDLVKLNALSRGRYTERSFQMLEVFAKVERVVVDEGRWLVLTPIVILSP